MRRAPRLAPVLALVLAACGRRTGEVATAPRLADEPWIRVGMVVDRDSAVVSATGQFRVLTADGAIVAVQDAGRPWRLAAGEGRRLRLDRPDRPDPVQLEGPLVIRPERESDLVTIGGQRLRGELVLQRGSAGVTVINRLPLEAYLRSVVALELGFRGAADRAAVMAQAVAARTFALRYRGRREALGFDVFPTDADQVYNGIAAESPEVTDAVTRTAGQIATWNGQPIEALFHSTCGWSTEASNLVFQGPVVPYLRAVSDRYGPGDRDFYCAMSPRFRWREEWDAATLRAILARTAGGSNGAIGRISNVTASGTTPTGRLTELIIETDQGRLAVPRGRIREVLRPAADRPLLSTLLQLHVEKAADSVTRVVAAGAGFGHGVGMCQFGAVGRARAGFSYDRILDAYYPGARLQRVY